jgi:hypothetical protein
MFEKLVWHADRMILDDLVFRLEHYKSASWDLGNDCFSFYKIKPLLDQYAKFWSPRQDFLPQNIMELGIWDGGSIAFWFEYFNPRKFVGIDVQQRQDSQYFRRYITSRGLESRISTYWATDQGDSKKLCEVIKTEFAGPLDLVIDDASHMYALTKQSFETIFPLLGPGGLYIIEDWAWCYWPEFRDPNHPWASEIPLARLIFELLAATGSSQGSSLDSLISNISVFQGFTVVERGKLELAAADFKVDKFMMKGGRTDHDI